MFDNKKTKTNPKIGPLAAFAKNFYHAPAVADAIKRIAGLDASIVDLVALGCLQQMRRMLREALGQVSHHHHHHHCSLVNQWFLSGIELCSAVRSTRLFTGKKNHLKFSFFFFFAGSLMM